MVPGTFPVSAPTNPVSAPTDVHTLGKRCLFYSGLELEWTIPLSAPTSPKVVLGFGGDHPGFGT
eukprot:527341-Amphidinium_carterae.1